MDLTQTARWLATTIPPDAIVVGYSLGARVALHLPLANFRPAALITIGGHPGLVDEPSRAQRRADDERLALRLESIGVAPFVREWLDGPLFTGLDDTTRFAHERHRNTADGLAGSLRLSGTGSQEDLRPRLAHFDAPVLAIAGQRDTKFAALAEEIAATVPQGRSVLIEGAGHSAHLERPSETAAALNDFLSSELD